jgi:hypothetical protein
MQDDQRQFLTLLAQPPARWTTEQTAWALNCQPHDIPVLVAARLLKPLGNPAPNSLKYFSAAEVAESARDRTWLARLTNALYEHWRRSNQQKPPVNGRRAGHRHAGRSPLAPATAT